METEISIMYSECVPVALVIQHATRVRHIDISGWLAVPHFSTLSHKRHDFRKKKENLVNMKCVFSFSLQILSDFSEIRIFSKDFEQNIDNKFRENLSSGSRQFPCRQTNRQRHSW